MQEEKCESLSLEMQKIKKCPTRHFFIIFSLRKAADFFVVKNAGEADFAVFLQGRDVFQTDLHAGTGHDPEQHVGISVYRSERRRQWRG